MARQNKAWLMAIVAILIIIGWTYAVLFKDQVYLTEPVWGEKNNITKYYKTGLFYIYTDKEEPLFQLLIRKNPPSFWSKDNFLNTIKQQNQGIKYNAPSNLTKNTLLEIINENPSFSENMKYVSSGFLSASGSITESYVGIFKLKNDVYTLKISDRINSVSGLLHNEPVLLDINLIKGETDDFWTYEKYLEAAKNQKQP